MATYTVTTLSDAVSHAGLSLRDALALANQASGADTIVFQAGLTGTISLAQGQIRVASDVAIIGDTNGDTKADITISGNDTSRVIIFESGNSSLDSLTLRDGTATTGGAVLVARGATLSIDYSRITSSQTVATSGEGSRGGGIANLGTLIVDHSTIDQNSAFNHGGGINNGGTMTISNSTINGNSANGIGGGILSDGGTLTATNLTIAYNTADEGGGIVNEYVFNGRNVTITGNTGGNYGAGVFNTGTFNVSDSIILGNGSTVEEELFGRIRATGLNVVGVGSDTNAADGVVNASSFASIFGGNRLADNGGTVRTILLTQGSNPAVNVASGSDIPSTDARGLFRNGIADLGAAERDGSQTPPVETDPPSPDPVTTIRGTSGSENLAGTVSNDIIYALSGQDAVTGGVGDDRVYGNTGSDRLSGYKGNDQIGGGLGDDVLTGGEGQDTFRFDYLSSVDRITDFNAFDDTVTLSHVTFQGLQTGELAASIFVTGSKAFEARDRIVYNAQSGELYFDVDGTGSQKAVVFAQLQTGLLLTADDFFVF
jgi:Ca2+-binding RTX toxin-like protein